MTLQKLASAIAFREGKKSQAKIGEIREVLKILFTMDAEDTVNVVPIEDGVRGVFDRESERIANKLYKQATKPRSKK